MRFGWTRSIGLTAAVIAGAALSTSPLAGAPAVEERTLYVNVMGANGPVLEGLSGGNFRVLEDGIVMEVTGLAPATAVPVSAMLMIDNTRAASSTVQDIRKAVVAYATQLLEGNPENEVGIYTFGSPAVVLQPLTSSLEDITRMANRIVANTDGSSLLNDGLVEAGKILGAVDNPRKVILMMNHEPAQEYSQVQFSEVAAAVQASGAQVHGVSIVRDNQRDPGREALVNALTSNSGGLYFGIGTPSGLIGVFESLAFLANVQYAVTYQRPDGAAAPKQTQVQVNIEGMKVLNNQWSGQ